MAVIESHVSLQPITAHSMLQHYGHHHNSDPRLHSLLAAGCFCDLGTHTQAQSEHQRGGIYLHRDIFDEVLEIPWL
jgi:hypothetical protein